MGGSRKGRHIRVTDKQIQAIRRLKDEGHKVAAIARATGLSRPTIYNVLGAASPMPRSLKGARAAVKPGVPGRRFQFPDNRAETARSYRDSPDGGLSRLDATRLEARTRCWHS